jgi:hypothetical protein
MTLHLCCIWAGICEDNNSAGHGMCKLGYFQSPLQLVSRQTHVHCNHVQAQRACTCTCIGPCSQLHVFLQVASLYWRAYNYCPRHPRVAYNNRVMTAAEPVETSISLFIQINLHIS